MVIFHLEDMIYQKIYGPDFKLELRSLNKFNSKNTLHGFVFIEKTKISNYLLTSLREFKIAFINVCL